jgi:macrodomain Ter protein organizer (MatP/YcbG family)
MVGLSYNPAIEPEPVSMALSNCEKQARYRERHLGADGKKARVGLILDATTRAKMARLARHKGYTITALVEELVDGAERRVTTRLTGKALKAYLDGE